APRFESARDLVPLQGLDWRGPDGQVANNEFLKKVSRGGGRTNHWRPNRVLAVIE
ncbi:unnamed protein product, partial [Prorocentrum cordatum]